MKSFSFVLVIIVITINSALSAQVDPYITKITLDGDRVNVVATQPNRGFRWYTLFHSNEMSDWKGVYAGSDYTIDIDRIPTNGSYIGDYYLDHDEFLSSSKKFQIREFYIPDQGICNLTNDLSSGSHGEDVAILQAWLEEEGYNSLIPSKGYGYFDFMTEAALTDWQIDHNFSLIGNTFNDRFRSLSCSGNYFNRKNVEVDMVYEANSVEEVDCPEDMSVILFDFAVTIDNHDDGDVYVRRDIRDHLTTMTLNNTPEDWQSNPISTATTLVSEEPGDTADWIIVEEGKQRIMSFTIVVRTQLAGIYQFSIDSLTVTATTELNLDAQVYSDEVMESSQIFAAGGACE